MLPLRVEVMLRRGGVATLFAAVLGVAAAAPAAPIVLEDQRGRRVELAAPAQRIVSLLPSLTETVCALQACDRLVGTDRHSNFPNSVTALPKLGGMEDLQIERIVALKPDLVLAAVSTRAIERLEALGIPVLALEPNTLAQTQRVMGVIAQALGRPQQAALAWGAMEQAFAKAAARVPAAQRHQRVYFEVAAVPYAAGQASFIGEVLQRLQLANIVPAALGPFPQLNPEFVLRAQPDLVMAAHDVPAQMLQRPGWAALRALHNGRVCAFSAAEFDVLMRPGPRLGDAAMAVAECLVKIDAASAARAASR
jgi:iron complex transport system substrate-binding protein